VFPGLKELVQQFLTHLKLLTLVNQHLEAVTPRLAEEFKKKTHILAFKKRLQFTLGDVVGHWKKSLKVKSSEILNNLQSYNTQYLLYNSKSECDFDIDIDKTQKSSYLSCICDVPIYNDLKSTLKISSDLDKIVLFILEKNIKISNVNVDYTNTNAIKKSSQRHKLKSVDYSGFTPHEDQLIKKNWEMLMEESSSESPQNVLDTLFNLRIKDGKTELLKKNVVALFLGQGMSKVRLASQIINQAFGVLINFVTGKISSTEHSIILDYIERNGESHKTFNDLRILLRRRFPVTISKHYKKWKEGKLDSSFKKGPFKKIESNMIIEEMIKTSKDGTVLGVHSNVKGQKGTVTSNTFGKLEDLLKRQIQNIRNHWEIRLKPILLQYHAGTLNFDVRTILVNYLLEKKVRFIQDIPWSQLLKCPQFSGHTKDSLTKEFEKLTLMTMNNLKLNRTEITIADMAETAKSKLSEYKVNLSGKEALEKIGFVEFYKNCLSNIN